MNTSEPVLTTGSVKPNVAGEEIDEVDEAPLAIWRAICLTIEGRIGLGLGIVVLGLICFGRFFAPYSPTEVGVGPLASGPSIRHLLGTDNLGRDVLSRFLVGGGSVILMALPGVGLAFLLGGTIGIASGYLRGRLDLAVTRLFDLLITLPPLLVVLVIVAGFGTSELVVILGVALAYTPRMGRIVRSATQAVVTNDYVAAAQARGESTAAICFREILPNIAIPVTADLAMRITYAILLVATLNFLGLGAQPPSSNWGLMIAESRSLIRITPWATLAPACGIAALSIAFNLLADALARHLSGMAYRGAVSL